MDAGRAVTDRQCSSCESVKDSRVTCVPTTREIEPAPAYGPVLAYIDGFWDRLIRHQPEDRGTLIGLPRPFLVPSVDPARPLFQEFYYWDTYFMLLGVYDTPREWLVIDAAISLVRSISRTPAYSPAMTARRAAARSGTRLTR